jgi:hypothetical protein
MKHRSSHSAGRGGRTATRSFSVPEGDEGARRVSEVEEVYNCGARMVKLPVGRCSLVWCDNDEHWGCIRSFHGLPGTE